MVQKGEVFFFIVLVISLVKRLTTAIRLVPETNNFEQVSTKKTFHLHKNVLKINENFHPLNRLGERDLANANTWATA